jgi:putative ABC transport system permease protein
MLIVRTETPVADIAPWIRSQVATLDPALPVDIATMRQRISKLADGPRFQTMLVGFFASTGLVLTMIGLYGVITLMVVHRTQEIGIRMALGADRRSILQLVLNKSLRIVFFGTALGIFLCGFTTHLLRSLLFNISPHDPFTFAIVPLLLISVACLATLIPASHAARVDPNIALRND